MRVRIFVNVKMGRDTVFKDQAMKSMFKPLNKGTIVVSTVQDDEVLIPLFYQFRFNLISDNWTLDKCQVGGDATVERSVWLIRYRQ